MPILNYTTKITPEKTVMEIQRILASKGAKSVMCEYDEKGNPYAMSFRVALPQGMVSFLMPVGSQGTYKAMKDDTDIPRRYRTMEQATRVAWRIRKDWIEAQMALIQVEQADLLEVFLPYAQTDSGRTVYQLAVDSGFKQLTSGG